MRLRALNLAHLRVDLALSDPGYPARFRQAAVEAATLGVGLEIALLVAPDRAAAQFEALRAVVARGSAHVARWLVFPERESFRGGTPLAEVVEPARAYLPGVSAAPILSGTNADFIFLARSVPPLDRVDGLAFPINPQVHAFDNASVVETLGVQSQAVANAQRLAAGKPVYVSPITLKMRHNPYATGAIPPTPPGQLAAAGRPAPDVALPGRLDRGEHQADGRGGRGGRHLLRNDRLARRDGNGVRRALARPVPLDPRRGLPGLSRPGRRGRVRRGWGCIPARSGDPLAFDGLALVRGDAMRVILANLTGEAQRVTVRGLPPEMQLRILDASNAEDAMREPEAFRHAPPMQQSVPATGLPVELPPYAVARMDGRRAVRQS